MRTSPMLDALTQVLVGRHLNRYWEVTDGVRSRNEGQIVLARRTIKCYFADAKNKSVLERRKREVVASIRGWLNYHKEVTK